jgi:hypothetical protein
MSGFEVFIKNEGSDYGDGFVINKYGDKYKLVSAREGKDGRVYMEWGFPQDKDKQPRPKAIPMGVPLGNYKEAINSLKRALQVLENPNTNTPAAAAKTLGGKVVDDSDINF